MRTKALILTAAVSIVGISAMAAEVTSANVVGFVNVTLKSGWNLICNPLKATNDTLNAILPSAPDFAQIFPWNAPTQTFKEPATFIPGTGWDVNYTINPGDAFFMNTDAGTITFVGEVRQTASGTLTATPLGAGYNFIGSQVAQAGGLTSVLGYTPPDNSFNQVFQWDSTAQGYKQPATYINAGLWDVPEPVLAMAEGIVVVSSGGESWTRTFNVQ